MNEAAIRLAPPMTLERSYDAADINAFANHPRVLPWIARPDQPSLDLTEAVADRNNVLLMTEYGGFLLIKLDAGTYEVHTIFSPEVPRGYALQASRAGLFWMFTRTDAMEILTKVPEGNIAARSLSLAAGMDLQYRGGRWVYQDGHNVAVEHFAVRYETWMLHEPRFLDAGHWFHTELEKQGEHADHAYDAVHDRFAGACVEMVKGGQVSKGIVLYNRWARFYGYAPIALLQLDPVVIDLVTCKVRVSHGEFTVCR